MKIGTIELRSGQWSWRVQEQWRGATVIFHHRKKLEDEMRTWVSSSDAMAAEAEENGRRPLSRTWSDPSGNLWALSFELPRWPRSGCGIGAAGEDQLWLVFRARFSEKRLLVPEDTCLGDLTHRDLAALLAAAS